MAADCVSKELGLENSARRLSHQGHLPGDFSVCEYRSSSMRCLKSTFLVCRMGRGMKKHCRVHERKTAPGRARLRRPLLYWAQCRECIAGAGNR